MKKRLRKKLDKQCAAIQRLSEMMTRFCGDMQTSTKRLQGLMAEMNGSLSRFPTVVKDWYTNPPIHSGEYIVWFCRKGHKVQTRKYMFFQGKWLDSRNCEVDMHKLRPAMWMMVPVINPGILEMYERREDEQHKD